MRKTNEEQNLSFKKLIWNHLHSLFYKDEILKKINNENTIFLNVHHEIISER